jgi:hypothetical protein
LNVTTVAAPVGFPDPARDGFEAQFYGVWVTER